MHPPARAHTPARTHPAHPTPRRAPRRFAADAAAKARGKHYQLACALAFEGITGAPHDTGINRPSDYYAAAMEAAGTPGPAGGSGTPLAAPQF